MGNCIVHRRVIKANKMVLESKPPMHVLRRFQGHAISDVFSASGYCLHPDPRMRDESLYQLLQSQPVAVPVTSKPTVRIKLVITRQELREMLMKGGLTVNDMVSHLQRRPCKSNEDYDKGINTSQGHKGWKPVLQSIPEMRELK